MALFHLSVTQTKRSAGQSAIASAAYRAGERLYSEYYGEYSDYTRKGGVICSDILLPSHAPPEYADRQTLWNAVEKAERGKNAQLAYSEDTQQSKPHAEPMLAACAKLGVAPQECLCVGDSPFDLQSGRNAGARTVAVRYTAFAWEKIMEEGRPDYVIAQPQELLELVKRVGEV